MDRNDTPTEKPKARIPSAVSVKFGRLPPLQRALLWTEEETGFEEKVEVVEVDVPPHKFETGTKNHAGLAGTTAAFNYLADLGAEFGAPFADEYPEHEGRRLHLKMAMAAIRVYERPLAEKLVTGLIAIPAVTVYGITDQARFDRRAPTAALTLQGYTPRQAAEWLGGEGIFVGLTLLRVGSHRAARY
jgi:selenocysteine lyase/cysteine desulfurase